MDINTLTPSLENLVDFLQRNPNAVLVVFIVSAVANIIQIGTYFRDRRRLREQNSESQKLIKLVDTYEYILNIAQKSLDTEDKLVEVEKDINLKKQQVNELNERIKMVQEEAQRALVSQAIEYNLGVLKEAYEEITRLREQYNSLGELPKVLEASREIIEEEVQIAVKRPYDLPRPFTFRSALMVLLIILVPGPLLGFIIPFLAQPLIIIFVEAISLFPNERLQGFVRKRLSLLGYITVLLAWNSLISSILFFIGLLVPPSLFPPSLLLTEQVSNIPYFLFLPLNLLISYQHWRIIRSDVHKAASKMLSNSIQSPPKSKMR
jgi:hypothetical protein